MVAQKCAIGIKGLHNIIECKGISCGHYDETRLCDQSVEAKVIELEKENKELKMKIQELED